MNPPPEFEYAQWFPSAPYALLARPGSLPDHRCFKRWQHVVRFWNYKAFGARVSWSIFSDSRPVSGRRAVVRRVTWNVLPSPLAPDGEGHDHIAVADADLVAEEVDARMAPLIAIPVSLYPRKDRWGLDGESFGIERPGLFHLSWWCHGPDEWADFTTRVATIREWLDGKFEGNSNPSPS